METEFITIFNRVKTIMKPYEEFYVARFDLESKYDLWSEKEMEIDGRLRTEMYFAGLIIQSRYVGFYFMPIYTDTSLKDVFETELLSLQKGKSCFHIKKLNSTLEDQIAKVLEIGHELYRKRGWV